MDDILFDDNPVTHAGIKPVFHQGLQVTINARTAIRYLRFRRDVSVNRLELAPLVYGRWVPNVPTHPAHLIISVLDAKTNKWKTIREVHLPFDPRISGEGLRQDMSIEEMETHFKAVLNSPSHVIDLGGIVTDHLRVECDREHPVWPSHGECNGGEFNVPFGILNSLQAYGVPKGPEIPLIPYHPILETRGFNPVAPKGMEVVDRPEMLLFKGERLSIGFSLKRPILMHLGWDGVESGEASSNRLLLSNALMGAAPTHGGLSGPMLRTLESDYDYTTWTGDVSVDGNRVIYSNLRSSCGVTIDAEFTVECDRVIVSLTQTADRNIPVIETEAWRLNWDETVGITGAAAVPSLRPGRSGDVCMPFMWASDGTGCLSCRLLNENKTARVQVESYRWSNCVTGGFILSDFPGEDDCLVIPAGVHSADFELAVASLEPCGGENGYEPRGGIKKHWGSVLSCFRPEFAGFSNNVASTNCHVNQCSPIDVVAFTRKPDVGPDPLDLARFTVGRGLLDGGGYGYWRNLYLDSDPILVSAAGRCHQVQPNTDWLNQIKPGLTKAIERMASTIGEEGLAICGDLTGNSGSFRWSSNAMDVIGFGHIDAYVNAWTYRAMRNAAALMSDLGESQTARRCKMIADGIKKSYAQYLLSPETGWIAGWRSRDGKYHDYAMIWVNGPAIAFGLLEPDTAKNALEGLERLRDEVGPGSARAGLPVNLIPISMDDHMLPRILGGNKSTFERYTDGALSGSAGTYYLRALSIYGLQDRARQLAEELNEGYATGMFTGGIGSGSEFRSWDGVPTGYEGTLIVCTTQVYAIAIEQGVLKNMDPEWWPSAAYLGE